MSKLSQKQHFFKTILEKQLLNTPPPACHTLEPLIADVFSLQNKPRGKPQTYNNLCMEKWSEKVNDGVEYGFYTFLK